ncbi:BLUF domain-containing protein [Ideonella sp. A 288]|uniref:BLUF domain-containing protein n=1 Tax=Ideonella sp. A 288 TaxID=1962181 RepID=UPI000B4B86B4|nr:BLUF domain-containing protein [Ideonella sp. A 288]
MTDAENDDTTRGQAPPPVDLYAILYVSTAARLLSLAELRHLQARAQARNHDEQVTGLLLYAGGAFMQYIEGTAAGLSTVYGVIKSDPLHYGVIDLLRQPIGQRQFGHWAMAMRVVDECGQSQTSGQDALVMDSLARMEQPGFGARDLLTNFWQRGRHSVAAALFDLSADRARRLAPTHVRRGHQAWA